MVLVVGLPRSHTSLLMQSLRLLGLDTIGDFIPSSINLKGHGETIESHTGIFNTEKYSSNHAIKILAHGFTSNTKITSQDKVIFTLRPPASVVDSQLKAKIILEGESELGRSKYWRILMGLESWCLGSKSLTMWVDTVDLVKYPEQWITKISNFVNAPKSIKDAVANVTSSMTQISKEEKNDPAFQVYTRLKKLAVL